MAWIKTGTVSISNGSKVATGVGTSFQSWGVVQGDVFTIDRSVFYEVASVDSETQITLVTAYAGTTVSGSAYAIIPTSTLSLSNSALATKVSNLLANWQNREAEYKIWQGGSATGGYDINGNPGSGSSYGYYPLTDITGTVTYVACPAKQQSLLAADTLDSYHASMTPAASQIPVLSASGGLVLPGAGYLQGDFSNSTLASRTLFKTSTGNGVSILAAVPNGTGVSSALELYNAVEGTTNVNFLTARIDGTRAYIKTTGLGTGLTTPLPLCFDTAATERMRLTAAGNLLIGTTTDNTTNKLQVSGTVGVGAGTAAAPAVVAATAPTTGIYFPTATSVATAIGGIEAGRFTGNSNLMIGTVSEVASCRFLSANNKTDSDCHAVVGNSYFTAVAGGAYVSYGVVGNAISTNIPSGIAVSGGAAGVVGNGYISNASCAGALSVSSGVRGFAGILTCAAGATVTNAFGVLAWVYNGSANGTITNAYGVYISNADTVGTITNRWGLYQLGAAANNYFQATVNIGTTSVNANYKLQVSGTTKSTRTLETVVTMTAGSAVTLDANAGSYFVLTPTQSCTINAANPIAGQTVRVAITTSGTSSYTVTLGTNFKSQGTLATGTVSAKTFVLTFACFDGTNFCEIGRTPAM